MKIIIIVAVIFIIYKVMKNIMKSTTYTESDANGNKYKVKKTFWGTERTLDDSWMSLSKSLDKHENLKDITDLDSYYKALREYYSEYGNAMLRLEIIMRLLHTYHLDKVLNKSADDIQKDLKIISNGEELPGEKLPIYKTKRWEELKSHKNYHSGDSFDVDFSDIFSDLYGDFFSNCNIYDAESYMNTLERYYLEFSNDMFDKDVINEFIRIYQLDTKFQIGYEDVIRDLHKIVEDYSKRNKTVQHQNSNHTPSVQAQSKQNQTVNTTPPTQPQNKHTQTTTSTPPVQPQDKQTQTKSNIPSAQSSQIVNNTAPNVNSTDTSFYSYVANMSNTQLVNTINGQYKAIKGTWSIAPCMGEYGSIEFAAVLLLWRYAVGNFNRNQESYASLQITLGDIIGCSFFGMPAGEWSDKKDPILNAHSDILTLEEFGDVYNHLKDNIIDEIHQMEFNNGNVKEEVRRQLYTKFVQIYNSTNDFSDMLDYYTEKGLKIKDSMSFSNSNQDIRKALLLQNWESCWKEFINDVDIDKPVVISDARNLSDKFYVSTYSCPTCGRRMYKAEFPSGKEFPIHIGNGKLLSMKRIFTCDKCQTFYTPLPERSLSFGECYCLKLANASHYRLLLENYDAHAWGRHF